MVGYLVTKVLINWFMAFQQEQEAKLFQRLNDSEKKLETQQHAASETGKLEIQLTKI